MNDKTLQKSTEVDSLRSLGSKFKNMTRLLTPTEHEFTPLTNDNVIKMGVFYKPIGVIYQIPQFNFPFWIAFLNITNHMVVGNTTLSRPDKSSKLPLTVYADTMKEARITMFDFGYSAEEDLDYIMSNSKIQGVTFTGSCPVGAKVCATAAKYMKRSLVELGKNNPFVVLEDADLN